MQKIKIMRKNTARAYELHLIGSSFFKKHYNEFKKKLQQNTDGGVYNSNGIRFEFGNINRVIKYIPTEDTETLNLYNTKYIYHLDSLKADRIKKICLYHSINKEELKKADILAIGNKNYYISVKDIKKTCKLGQTSAEVIFNDVKLKGGIKDYIKKFNVKNSIEHTDTKLTEKQFSKLSSKKDRTLAYIKKKFPEKWNIFVNENLNNAYNQLINLEKSLNSNNTTLASLLNIMLSGSEKKNKNFYIWIEPNLCNIDNLIKTILQKDCQIETFFLETENKKSLVITITYNDKKYGITKIEPAFDGALDNVSQTKGIIYYFQQYPNSNNNSLIDGNIWDLIQAFS